MKRGIALTSAVSGTILLLIVMLVGWNVGRGAGYAAADTSTAAPKAAATVATPPHFSLQIHTGEQLANEKVGPAFSPSSFTLPADTMVTISITNFDNATALPDGYAQYAKATGIDKNSFQTAPLDATKPNAEVASTTADNVAPALMSHTFTIPQLKLNVPIAAMTITTFSFHTPTAGKYTWRCMDPCGIDPNGWGGAMSMDGYMQGTVTFA